MRQHRANRALGQAFELNGVAGLKLDNISLNIVHAEFPGDIFWLGDSFLPSGIGQIATTFPYQAETAAQKFIPVARFRRDNIDLLSRSPRRVNDASPDGFARAPETLVECVDG